MDRAKLDEIIFYLKEMLSFKNYIDDDINLLNKIYLIMGEKIEEKYHRDYKYLINNVKIIVEKILNLLNEEDKKYLKKQIPKFIKYSFLNNTEKIKSLETLKQSERGIVIQSLEYSDEEKVELIKQSEDKFFVIELIKSIENDDIKISLLGSVKTELEKTHIIETLRSDDKKVELLRTIKGKINKASIIKSVQDDEIKLKLLQEIESKSSRANIISSMQEDDIKIKLLENIEDEKDRVLIILSVKNDDTKIRLLELVEELKNKIEIIKTINDDKKKLMFLDEDLHENYRVQIISSLEKDENKLEMLETLKNPLDKIFIIKMMKTDDGKIEALDFLSDLNQKLLIINSLNDDRKKDYALNTKIDSNLKSVFKTISEFEQEDSKEKHKYTSLGIPKDMSVGIEIECDGKYQELVPERIGKWKRENDISISNRGREIISPKLYDSKKTVEEIYKINEILQNIGMKAVETTGGHVHIGADYITEEAGFRELLELWGNAEEIYYLISNRAGELPRKGIEEYAKPISYDLQESDINGMEADDFIEKAQSILKSRYRGLNIQNINVDNKKNTIEFRLSNGTLDGDTWIENIRLYGRTVEIAQKLGEISEKLENKEEIPEEEKRLYGLKERLKQNISLDEKMEILMEILFYDEEERKVYQKRYEVNRNLDRKVYRLSRVKFGKVDFGRVYQEIEIPEGIINDMKLRREENKER